MPRGGLALREQERWRETKYVLRDGHLRASRDARYVAPASRLAADLVGRAYEGILPRFASGRLLDFGCGTVPLYRAYRPFITDVVCADWTANAHVDLVCDLSAEVPLQSSSFDTILASDVLEHLPNPTVTWGEFHRLLVARGRVIANVPFCYGLHEEPHDYFRFTEYALRMHAETAGFDVLAITPVGGAPEVVADVTGKVLASVRIGVPLGVAVQTAAALVLRTQVGSRLSAKTARRFPLSYMVVAEKA
jgi:SAM-dependent methyltransferase